MSLPARWRAIASAPVVRKGSPLRSDERAKERRALDCRLRYGCFSAMKRMSSSHVPHEEHDCGGPAAQWLSVDTIPKPDGLAGPVPGPESNGDATKAGRCPALFVRGSRSVRGQR
jgi:hypothetical protein